MEALVRHLQLIDTGKPSRIVDLPGPASVLRLENEIGIAIGTDGVGTKMIVAERLERFDTIGIDCVAMNVNDLICVGAEPEIAMVDFILCERADPRSAARSASVCAAGRAGRDRDPRRRDRPGRRDRERLGARGDGDRDRGPRRARHRESIEPGDAVLGLPSSGSTPTATLARRRCSPTSTRPRIPTAGWADPR